jgi:DNA-binding CsgD family transcriptional regulator
MATDGDGLTLVAGVLGPTQPGDRGGFTRALVAALDPGIPASHHIFRLNRRSGQLPLIARSFQIPGRDISQATSSLVLLLVVDPTTPGRVTANGIRALGVLSKAELDICDLIVRGHGTAEIASLRGTTIQTATDQVKSALSKLGCATRLDIVRLAMATRPPGPD